MYGFCHWWCKVSLLCWQLGHMHNTRILLHSQYLFPCHNCSHPNTVVYDMIYWPRIFWQYCSQVAREWKRVDKLYKVNTYKEVMNCPSVEHDQWLCHWWCRVSPFSVDNLSMCYTELSLFPARADSQLVYDFLLCSSKSHLDTHGIFWKLLFGILTFWETFSHTLISLHTWSSNTEHSHSYKLFFWEPCI
jgi:hypothetical protein